jgi:flagellar hook-associated protein 2
VNLLTSANQGTNAQFDLNGIGITRSSNEVNDIIPGLSFTLESATNSATPVTLSLQTDPTQLSSALSTFVNDYNSLVAQVQQQQGTSGGPLTGDTVISQISDDLRQLTTFYLPSSTGGVQSLSDLGITFNTTGQLSFDQSTFSALSTSQVTSAFKFLGSSTSGFAGFTQQFTQLSDPATGLILSEENGLDAEDSQLNDQIATKTAQVTALQASVTAQAQQADALVAELQSEQTTLTASIQSVDLALYGQQNVGY